MSKTRVKLGVLLPTRGLLLADAPPSNANLVLDLAQKTEEAGLDSVWVGDSLTAKPRLEPLSVLAAIAARTSRVRLGTAVLLMALRHPLLLAQTLGTVDLISQGRLLVAAGAGGAFNVEQQQEWQRVGVKASQRASRLAEMVQIIKGLNRGETVSFQGRHFELDSVAMRPRSVQTGGVPILLACHGRFPARGAQIQRAARWADGVISISDTPDEYRQVVRDVRALAAELGRDASSMEAAMYLTVNLDRDMARGAAEAEQWLLGYYGTNIWGSRWGPFGDPSQIKERIAEYAEAGADTVIVRFASFTPKEQLDAFLNEVAPVFQ
ncbi:MAG TPA: LLM class flavin-dependent oxidoreductase [Dehalococcoidia bacterium]|nr:LLM class flavin-dependent oxidoreductase [Dehalococcoidia bacterium]